MSTTLAAESAVFARAQALLPCLRARERISVVFFFYLAGLAWVRHSGVVPRVLLPALSLAIWTLAAHETAHSRPWSLVLRDWLSMGLILPAYSSVGWFATSPLTGWQETWLGWDRVLLDGWGLRAGIESTGMLLPPICMALLYWIGERGRLQTFLFLLLGTLCAYAVLPLFPMRGPRVVYPGLDVPGIDGIGRKIHVWVLRYMDLPPSVFPSGHAAGGFSTALGMLAAVPRRPFLWGCVFTLAVLDYVATIYCRYHYVVDGLATKLIGGRAYAASRRGGAIV